MARTLTVCPAVTSLTTISAAGGGGNVPVGGSIKMQLETSLLLDFRGARGSMGFGEQIEHGHTNSPSRRFTSADLDLGADATWTASMIF